MRNYSQNIEPQAPQPQQGQPLFFVKTASTWIDAAKDRPKPRQLFGELWFEGEICIMFADSNVGKSILSVQIGESIASGKPVAPLALESIGEPILYFDFELSDMQFTLRYINEDNQPYRFSNNFFRCEINTDTETPEGFKDFESYVAFGIEQAVQQTKSRVLIIDNISFISQGTEKTKDALEIMKKLKKLKAKYNLSILVLAHTPKIDPCQPIGKRHLAGSKALTNFCDSMFAIGQSSQDDSFKYVKQLKVRNCEHVYPANNVLVYQIHKPNNFLKFDFLGFGKEWDHLKQIDKDSIKRQIIELYESQPSLQYSEIAEMVETYPKKVARTIQRHKEEQANKQNDWQKFADKAGEQAGKTPF